MSIVARFYPNGEFSQGVDTSHRRLRHVCKKTQTSVFTQSSTQISNRGYTNADILQCARQNSQIPAQIYSKKGTAFKSTEGEHFTLVETGDDYCVLERSGVNTDRQTMRLDTSIYRAVHVGLLSPLVHQSVESCEIPKSRKKLSSMSKLMSRNIRNAVYLLEKQPGGKDVLSFLTLTLPNLSTEGLTACCENWDSMVKRFIDWLRVTLGNADVQLQYVYCTEIQTKRLTNRGEYAPHLHIVFRGRTGRGKPWIISPKKARSEWGRCISAYVSESFDTRALENLQRIKHSAARYLSKYLSKGSNVLPSSDSSSPVSSLRTQWGGMARTLSKGIRKATQTFRSDTVESWFALSFTDNLEKLHGLGYLRYFKRGFISLGTNNATRMEYGLHVSCGCLRTPTSENGLFPIIQFLASLEG